MFVKSSNRLEQCYDVQRKHMQVLGDNYGIRARFCREV